MERLADGYYGYGYLAADCSLGGRMDHLHGVMRWFLSFIIGAFFSTFVVDVSAFAPTPQVEYSCGTSGWQPSKSAACNSYLSETTTTGGTLFVGAVEPQCRLDKTHTNGTVQVGFAGCTYSQRNTTPVCAPNSTANASNTDCTCNPGFQTAANGTSCEPLPPPSCGPQETRVNGVCVPDTPCNPGEVRINGVCKKPPKCPKPGTSAGDWTSYSSGSKAVCENGCVVLLAPADVGIPTAGGTVWTHAGTFTGAECSGTSSSPGSGPGSGAPPTSPGQGPAPGADPNAPQPDGTPQPEKKPATTPPPPAVEPQAPNPDGSCPAGTKKDNGACIKDDVPPDTDGKCPGGATKVDGTCVFSVPGGDGGSGGPPGSGTGTGTGTGTGEGSSFGGNCSSGFACTGGDAIQCAVAKEQYVRNCKFYEDKTEAHAAKFFAEDGKEGNGTSDLPGNSSVTIGAGNFDSSNALGTAASGAQDLTVTVMGRAWSLPFSVINPYLAILGNIFLGVAFLLSARIVARG